MSPQFLRDERWGTELYHILGGRTSLVLAPLFCARCQDRCFISELECLKVQYQASFNTTGCEQFGVTHLLAVTRYYTEFNEAIYVNFITFITYIVFVFKYYY